ncbi:hypothetical protein JN11_00904 [Mucilaginibacter frigoritolerans]|jgi:hypothetical protein|uniref:Uncharacterized protein n=1 Tax=Mucilaginibacter frigoritolerans TaxID=652788 RepID=A0A562UC29_9SPHI|nr:hypothetical protein [Mucilaginibacter frigoritolerans]TWJ03366.1 hypothetical protein JN11_00904 [Mucilaginibacter frigoritolerans]
MEERKTAAIVLPIIALIILFFTVIFPEIRKPQTISFKSCKVQVEYFTGLEEDANRATNNKLALCLCDLYVHNPDSAIASQILKIYREYGTHDSTSYGRDSLNSIIKNKKTVFDTLILLD